MGEMMKRLRKRFILLGMLSAGLVLVLILGAVNIYSYASMLAQIDGDLEKIAANNGIYPGLEEEFRKEPELPFEGPEERPEGLPDREGEEKPEGLAPDAESRPEAPFEIRYFTILLDDEGQVIRTDVDRIAAVDEGEAQQLALDVAALNRRKGTYGDYRYLIQSKDGSTLFIFVDRTRDLDRFSTFLTASVLISLGGMAGVFCLLCALSGRVIAPFVEAHEKQKRFITDAGHEIRTPLTIIDADAQVLSLDLGENEWLGDIRRQSARLRVLTDDLVYLARLEEKEGSGLPFVEFPISEAAKEAAASFRAAALKGQIRYETAVTENLVYTGEPKSLNRLFSILLDNAMKYTPREGEVRFALSAKGKGILLTVFNTAQELDPKEVPKLFDRFYRTDESRNSKTGGHGIGLSIARAIVTAHKGRITASSEDGRSLTITVLLP